MAGVESDAWPETTGNIVLASPRWYAAPNQQERFRGRQEKVVAKLYTTSVLLARISLIELDPLVLGRALQPFPAPTRTLDALHLASASWLRERGAVVRLATYDARLAEASRAIGLDVLET